MKPLMTNATIAQYKRAKEALERFHRREKRRREEEVQEVEASNLRRRGITAEDLQFEDSLSDPSDIEEQYGDGIAARLPSRANQREEVQEQGADNGNGDEARFFDDNAGEVAPPPPPDERTLPLPPPAIPSSPHSIALPRSPNPSDSSLDVSELLQELRSKAVIPPAQLQGQPMEIDDSHDQEANADNSGGDPARPYPMANIPLPPPRRVEPLAAYPRSPNTDSSSSSSSPHRVSQRMAGLGIHPVHPEPQQDPQEASAMEQEEESDSSDRFTAAQNEQLGYMFQ